MSLQDKQKWDKKYQEKEHLLLKREPSAYLQKYSDLCEGKKALDLACGAGRNALYLAQQGFSVDAVDIAAVALEKLNHYADVEGVAERVETYNSDLDTFAITKAYDLVIMMNFLDRDLIQRVSQALSSGAIFIVETYMQDSANEKKVTNSDFLLQKEELKTLFQDGFKIVAYDEFKNEAQESFAMQKQLIVAKKL